MTPTPEEKLREALEPCPFCGGPAKRTFYNGTDQGSCGASSIDCPGADAMAPAAMWNARASYRPDGVGGEASWQHFLASDMEWLADHGRKMGPEGAVGPQAIQRLLAALARLPALPVEGGAVHSSLPQDKASETEAFRYIWARSRVFEKHGQLRPDQPPLDELIGEELAALDAAAESAPQPQVTEDDLAAIITDDVDWHMETGTPWTGNRAAKIILSALTTKGTGR